MRTILLRWLVRCAVFLRTPAACRSIAVKLHCFQHAYVHPSWTCAPFTKPWNCVSCEGWARACAAARGRGARRQQGAGRGGRGGRPGCDAVGRGAPGHPVRRLRPVPRHRCVVVSHRVLGTAEVHGHRKGVRPSGCQGVSGLGSPLEDGCNSMAGPCYTSKVQQDYDLCSCCRQQPQAERAAPFARRQGRTRGQEDNGPALVKWCALRRDRGANCLTSPAEHGSTRQHWWLAHPI